MYKNFMKLRRLQVDARAVIWLKYYELMLGPGGWLSDSPGFDLDEKDGCRHRRIRIVDEPFQLIDEWRIGGGGVTGTTVLLRAGEPVLSGWYCGTIISPEHTSFLKRALHTRFTWAEGSEDYGLFRGPHRYEPEGELYYSNEHFGAIGALGSRFNSGDRLLYDGGEEAICKIQKDENEWPNVLASNTYFVQVIY